MSTIFSRLAEGSEMLSLYNKALNQGQSSWNNPVPAVEFTQDSKAQAFLPLFSGSVTYRDTPSQWIGKSGIGPTYPLWVFPHFFSRFWRSLRHYLREAMTTEPLEGGMVRQVLRAAAAADAWAKAVEYDGHTSMQRSAEHIAAHIAAQIAALGGVPWHISDDGEGIYRELGAYPARLPEVPVPMKLVTGRDVLADTLAYVILPGGKGVNDSTSEEILMLSLVGRHRALKAVWSDFMSNDRKPMHLPTFERAYYRDETGNRSARRLAGKGNYKTFWKAPLPESGLAHLVIEYTHIAAPQIGKPFAHIVGTDGIPDMDRLFEQLDAALRLPIQREWMPKIWEMATETDALTGRPELITTLPSFGCTGYWVEAGRDADWAKIVAACAGATGPQAGQIETVGTLSQSSVVIADGADNDNDDATE